MTRRYTKAVKEGAEAEMQISALSVPKTVIVLCCHRSGSSAVAGVLHYLGVDLGRGNFLGVNADNPMGYFEDARMVVLNDNILKACGTSWQATEVPTNLWDIWPRFSKTIKQLRNRQDTWGWKDPRTVLTLPLFQRWINNPHYVVVLRDPKAVAQSLERRDGTAYIQALDYASRYYHLIRRTVRGLAAPTIEVQYEKLIASPKTEIERLARFIGLNGRVPDGLIDPTLNHFAEPRTTEISGQSGDTEETARDSAGEVPIWDSPPIL